MHEIEECCYKYNQVLSKTLGLWPYQRSCFARIQKVLLTLIFLLFILVQLLVLVTTQYDTNLLLRILSFILPVLFIIVKYWLFIIQTNSVKQLLTQIQNDWRLLKNQFEIDIIKKYAYNAKLFTVNVTVACCISTLFIAVLQSLPLILDVILPLNESRQCHIFFVAEYFVNQEQYIYIILLHEVLVFFFGTIILCSTSGILIMYVLHACALFDIASFRIENAITKGTIAIPSPGRDYLLYQKIVQAVVIHRRAIECITFFASNFTVLFAILIVVGVSSLSFNLFQFIHVVTITRNVSQGLIIALMIVAHLIYMFAANNAGQEITDHGRKLFNATYTGLWYETPLNIQRLLLFIMQKGTMNVTITLGSVFVASLEGFAMLINMAVSYFAVIYSTR